LSAHPLEAGAPHPAFPATPGKPASARFGAVIRQLRESRGWSQEHLAGLASLNRSYMGEVERAAAMPSLATAEKLARALDVALSTLISRCEDAGLN
jgi:XRE family transcriptional regulator, regulator of sulfur utilization